MLFFVEGIRSASFRLGDTVCLIHTLPLPRLTLRPPRLALPVHLVPLPALVVPVCLVLPTVPLVRSSAHTVTLVPSFRSPPS